MAGDGKIYITISDKRSSGQGGIGDVSNVSSKVESEQNALLDFATHKFFNFIQQQVTQSINFELNNIGNFTGNYVEQRRVTESISAAKSILNLGASALAGFKYGGAAGAIYAMGTSLLMQSVNFERQERLSMIQNKKTNFAINQLRTRAGLNSLLDGSRGTLY